MTTLPTDLFDVELAELLGSAVSAVVRAQRELDAVAVQRIDAFTNSPPDVPALPPLWHVVRRASIEVELSASVREPVPGAGARLLCRPVSAVEATLYGREATAGLRVGLIIEPGGTAVLRTASPAEATQDEPCPPTPD